jgi:hypothetical protein
MRTLQEVLTNEGPAQAGSFRKPAFRSSGLFPIYEDADIHTRLTFLGYWPLRSKGRDVGIFVTVRDEYGAPVLRKHFNVSAPQVYALDIRELMADSPERIPAHGSIEMEVFSSGDLVFPFPAVVLNYYGDNFSTVVHTSQRVFNDAEDAANSLTFRVPEGGFNIYGSQDMEPFVDIINGPNAKDICDLQCTVSSLSGTQLSGTVSIGALQPYQRVTFRPGEHFDLPGLLGDKPGTLTFNHPFTDVFPRFVVGNRQRSLPGMSISHSIYDMRAVSDYWPSPGDEWLHNARMIPAFITGDMFTKLYMYSISSHSLLALDCELFDSAGKLMGHAEDVARIDSPTGHMSCLDIGKLADALAVDRSEVHGARVSTRPLDGHDAPARIGGCLDIGHNGRSGRLPTNISFAFIAPNPGREGRGSFRWGPLLADNAKAYLSISNSSVLKKNGRSAEASLTVYRSQDDVTLERKLTLPNNGSLLLDTGEGSELHDFLSGEAGWYTVATDNANLNTWYLADNESGIVGGDHGF